MAGKLSLVGTPIGNISDMSPRATEALQQADAICCEDTRVTGKLLSLIGVDAAGRLERCDENVIARRLPALLERLQAGETIAFCSDAGMPGISDPGQLLADAALDASISVTVIPGPSAVVCALVVSGLASEHFFFEGFLPRKASSQKERLALLALVPGSLVIYESPRRVAETLANIAELFPERRVALIRELTKLHEECVRAKAPELAQQIAERTKEQTLKGECVIVIEAPSEEELARSQAALTADGETPRTLEEAIAEGKAQDVPPSALAKRLAKQFKLPKSEVYQKIVG